MAVSTTSIAGSSEAADRHPQASPQVTRTLALSANASSSSVRTASSSPVIAVPVVEGGKLKVVGSSYELRQSAGDLVPPTDAGWLRFLELRGDAKSAELRRVARDWWCRALPRWERRRVSQPQSAPQAASTPTVR